MIWERTRYLMPCAARDIPPNHCSHNFYYSKFKGVMNKHRDVKKKKDGTSQFLPGTPIVSVTIAHPMLFEVYAPVDKDGKDTYSSNAVTKCYKDMVSAIIMSHGQVLIWQARDDERYMNALRFEKFWLFSVEHYRTPHRPVFHPLNALALVGFLNDTPQFHLLEFRASLL
jgi:hypothetical protein